MLFAYYRSSLFQYKSKNYVSFDIPVVPAAFSNAVGYAVSGRNTGAETVAFTGKRRTAGGDKTFRNCRRQKAQLHRNHWLYAAQGRKDR